MVEDFFYELWRDEVDAFAVTYAVPEDSKKRVAELKKAMKGSQDVVLATDAHNVRRCSGMSAGYTFVRQRFGAGRADDLLDRADRVLRELLAAASGSTDFAR